MSWRRRCLTQRIASSTLKNPSTVAVPGKVDTCAILPPGGGGGSNRSVSGGWRWQDPSIRARSRLDSIRRRRTAAAGSVRVRSRLGGGRGRRDSFGLGRGSNLTDISLLSAIDDPVLLSSCGGWLAGRCIKSILWSHFSRG